MNKRSDVEEILKTVVKEAPQKIKDDGFTDYGDYILMQPYTINEKTHFRCRCSVCGRIWDESVNNGYWSCNPKCPDCQKQFAGIGPGFGAANSVSWTIGSGYRQKRYDYMQELDNGFAIINYYVKYEIPIDPDNIFDWLTESPTATVYLESALVFDKDFGYMGMTYMNRFYPEMSKILKRGTVGLKDLVTRFKSAIQKNTVVNANSLKTSPADWILAADNFLKQQEEETAKKKSKSKAGQIEEVREKYVPKKFDFTRDAFSDRVFYKTVSAIGSKRTYECYCAKCKTKFTKIGKYGEEFECPTCGLQFATYDASLSDRKTYITFESTTLPENDLLIRKWNFSINAKRNASGDYEIETSADEELRVFCGKKITYYSVRNANFEKITGNSYLVSFYNAETVQNQDDIRIAFTNSCLRYSGAIEAFGFSDKYKQVCEPKDLAYMIAWYKHKSLEYIVKSNLTRIAKEIIRDPNNVTLNDKANTPYEALGVSKAVFKIASELNLRLEETKLAQAIWVDDNSLTSEKFKEFRDSGLNIESMLEIRSEYGIPIDDTIKYIQSAYNHQCIEKQDAISIWKDYLHMAKILNIDLKDKSRRFPASMKKEHDVAAFAFREVQQAIDKEKFKKQAEENIEKYGDYTYKDFMIVIPMCPEDVINEATQQKNCLRSYLERIKNGDTTVCFIRKKDDPDDSYVTVEVYRGKITQLRGFCNSNPRDKKLMEFVGHWMAAKGIGMNC